MIASSDGADASVVRDRSDTATCRPSARLSAINAGAHRITSGVRRYARSGLTTCANLRQAIVDLPVQIGRGNAPLIEAVSEGREHFGWRRSWLRSSAGNRG